MSFTQILKTEKKWKSLYLYIQFNLQKIISVLINFVFSFYVTTFVYNNILYVSIS